MVSALRRALVRFAAAVAGVGALLVPTWGEGVRILTPTDGAVIYSADALLVFTAGQGARVVVGVGSGVLELPDIVAGGEAEEVHHLRVPLPEGKSFVRLVDAGEERAELARLSLVRGRPSDRRATSSADAFHTASREASCSGCHRLPAPARDAEALQEPPQRFCRPCHPTIEDPPYLHGPSAVYACFSCHVPEYSPARFVQRLPQPASCAGCHTELMARVLGGKKFVHGPAAAGDCTMCHDPHGGQTATLMRGTVSGLCLSCHESNVGGGWSASLHRALPCTGCHDPHGGRTPDLTVAEGNDLCTRCHLELNPLGHAFFGHPLGGGGDPSVPGKVFGCASCHPPHGINDVARRRIGSNDGAQRAFCLGCHG